LIDDASDTCGAICDCSGDAGAVDGSAPDAAEAADAADAASDAGAVDASDAGADLADASDIDAAPEQTVKCGVFGCSDRCQCQSQSLSTCVCFSGDCHK